MVYPSISIVFVQTNDNNRNKNSSCRIADTSSIVGFMSHLVGAVFAVIPFINYRKENV